MKIKLTKLGFNLPKRLLFLIMRTFIFLLCTTVFSFTTTDSFSQKQVTIDMDKEVSVDEVFNIIQNQTRYRFLYPQDLFTNAPKVHLKKGIIPISRLLKQSFVHSDVKFEVSQNNTIVITESPKMISSEPIATQNYKVSGTVTDHQGVPMIGANIIEKGTTNGTQTDFDGNFSISLADENAILVVSYLGYVTKEVSVKGMSQITIVLKESAAGLDEVIIVAYDRQSKSSYTGAAVEVDLKAVEETPLASFQESLQGNVAGLQMSTKSGQPGSAPDIRIRGIGSINASSDPLYVIDGIPVVSGNIANIGTNSNTIAGLNPNDIANITVLKDASATAIYGSRGGNGVILITTKKGKEGKTRFDVNVQSGISNVILPDRMRPLNSKQHIELLIESRVNTGESMADATDFILDNVDPNVDTDWVDVITRQGLYQQYNLSANGGNENTKFYASMGYYDQEAVVIGIDYKKFNSRVNINHQATDKFNIDFGVGLSHQILHSNSDAGNAANPVRAMLRTVPWEPVYNEDGSYNTDILLTYNPVGLVEKNIRETKLYGVLANLSLKYDLTKNLSFETKGNVDFNLADEFRFDNPEFGEGRNDGGRGRAFDNKILNYNITNLLKYNLRLNNDHNFNFLLGQEAQKINESSLFAFASNYGAPGLTTLSNASVYREASSTKTASSISSYFFNVSYALMNKYYFNATARRDGSSRFGSDVRYANFGSVGLAWNITKEKFLEDSNVITNLKLRTSYGINGNQEIGNFASRGLYSTGADYDGEPGYIYSQQINKNLTWEKNKPFNVGIDFNLINRISGTVEYYHRTTTDLLFRVPISATNGLTTYFDNIGEMKNSGIELVLNTINFDNQDGFSWLTNFNFTSNSNEITKLKDGQSIIDDNYIREIGGDFYTFYMPGFAGADPDNGEALWYLDSSESQTTNQYSEAQPYNQGSALPDFFAGLTNTFTYKNLSFSFLLYLNYGNKVYDPWGRYTSSDGSARLNDRGNMTRNIYNNRWQQPGDVTNVPKVVYGNKQSGLSSQHSTRFLYDGTYLRLRDVSLGYSLSDAITKKMAVNEFKIYLKASNLLTWVKDKNIEVDPEVGIGGQSDLRIPISSQFLIGLNISL